MSSMQRPMMDITYMDDAPDASSGGGARGAFRPLRVIGKALWRLVKPVGRVLFYDPLSRVHFGRFRNEEGTPFSRFLRGFAYRLAFMPILAALAACAMVYVATHPLPAKSTLDPASQGIYYDAITCMTEDSVRLEAWLVPAIDARRVIDQKDSILREKHAAVVLLHDGGNRREQMLPLVKPLHEAGMVVLVLGMRGNGTSQRSGQTFGLREALDVKAAVETLRRRPFVDPERVAVVGVGAGANAALLAMQSDKRICAAVLTAPFQTADQVVETQLLPQQAWLRWMRPLCKWTFELSYEVDVDELNLDLYKDLLKQRPTMVLPGNASLEDFSSKDRVELIREFLVIKTHEGILGGSRPVTADTGTR